MKSFFDGIATYFIEKIKANHGEIEAQKDINVFVKEMNEIKKEITINIEKYRDLFED